MKCAIVDAYGAGRHLPAALRHHGVEFIHIRSDAPDWRLSYRPDEFTVDLKHEGDLDATAARVRGHGVGLVVAGAESGVLLADQLSAALGTPGNGMSNPLARRDKFVMHRAIADAGLAAAAGFRSESLGAVLDWVDARAQWPVVLKPPSSAGGDNVFFCHSTEEIREAYARITSDIDRYGRRNRAVLANEFLAGTEYYVNSVSRAGTHRVVEVWRYHKRSAGGRTIYDYEDLLAWDDPTAQQIVTYTLAVLDALEIRNGAAHTEVMLTAVGPVLVECGARLGGGQMPALLTRCTGTNQVDSLALAIVDPEEFARQAAGGYRLYANLRCVNLISERDGVMPAAAAWEPVRTLASFDSLVLNIAEGTPLAPTTDLATCPGSLYLCAPERQQVVADHDRLRHLERAGLYDS